MYSDKLMEAEKIVPYLDLSGSLNTKKDAHALSRNQLATSINGWYAQGNTFSKRPGNVTMITGNGATGGGGACAGMASARYNSTTQLLVQSAGSVFQAPVSGSAWNNIGTYAGGTIQAAQIMDPSTTQNSTFIVDGVDQPRIWNGTGVMVACTGGTLPLNATGSAPITPAFVNTLFGSLFYAGEPTVPEAVYISDPYLPQSFTQNALTGSASTYGVGGSYIPYFAGRGDGVNGGNITGMDPLGGTMVIYKQSAIYRFDLIGLFGDSIWSSQLISSSVGCLSPRSLVAFDTFHVILGIDGVYTVDLVNGTRRISDNIPTFFDGPTADILDRTTAVGVRYGQRYLIFYDNGNGTGTPAGHPTTGMWFDFSKPDEDGYPSTGQIQGMTVNGVAPMRGPKDTGTFAWCDGGGDRVGQFGIGFGDFGQATTVALVGKADFYADIFKDKPEVPAVQKVVNAIRLLLSVPATATNETLTFTFFVSLDYSTVLSSVQTTQIIPGVLGGSVVGTAQVGTAIVGLAPGASAFLVSKAAISTPPIGHVVQLGFSESSVFPWTTLGYLEQVALHGLGGLDEQ